VSSLASLCTTFGATPISEVAFLTILTGPSIGVDPTIADEIVACLKAAGIVFNPWYTWDWYYAQSIIFSITFSFFDFILKLYKIPSNSIIL
jgi:hypothetical protein